MRLTLIAILLSAAVAFAQTPGADTSTTTPQNGSQASQSQTQPGQQGAQTQQGTQGQQGQSGQVGNSTGNGASTSGTAQPSGTTNPDTGTASPDNGTNGANGSAGSASSANSSNSTNNKSGNSKGGGELAFLTLLGSALAYHRMRRGK